MIFKKSYPEGIYNKEDMKRVKDIEKKFHYKHIGSGASAHCFDMNNGCIFKLFRYTKPLIAKSLYEVLLKQTNDTYFFPIELKIDNEGFKGYVMNKAFGKSLDKAIYEVSIDDVGKSLIKLEEDTDKLSNQNIIINDFKLSNMIYDEGKISVIDTDEYRKSPFFSKEEARKENNLQIKETITRMFLHPYLNRGINERFILNRIQTEFNTDVPINQFLFELKNKFENYYNEKIETIQDLDNIIRR